MALGKFANRIVGSGEESLDQIQFNPRNWRVHPLNQQNALKGVLEEVGWVQEVIINQRTGHLVDGHLRCQLAAREGAKTIPVKYVDLSEEEEALVLSTLDPIAAMATTDKAKLDELFASIETDNADVLKMLDDIAEKERLEYAKRDPVDAEPQIDRAAELNEKWQVVTGDLWQIGEHRLLCGDSTKREDVERLLENYDAETCVTDPPYNVGKEFENDKLSEENFDEFNKLWVGLISNSCTTFIAFHSPQKFPSLLFVVINAGYKFGRMLWLWKPGTAFGVVPWHGWARRSECILVFERNAKWPEWVDYHPDMYDHKKGEGATEDTVDKETVLHPTVKPLWVVQDLINHTVGNVYEPFCGSGTTMVACQNLNRKCRAIEISPNYCAVILERMHAAFPELEIKRLA